MEQKKTVIITIQRETYTSSTTIGKLYVNGTYVCDTLEDVCRDLNRDGDLSDLNEFKVQGQTAIPAGTYKLKIRWSPNFKQRLFWVQGVQGFEFILIHAGNTKEDTKGCILLGYNTTSKLVAASRKPLVDSLVDSRKALKRFHDLVMGKYDEYILRIRDLNLN